MSAFENYKIIVRNFYGGVDFLNENFYELPDTHCTKPIELAKTPVKNSNFCGSAFQQKQLESKSKTTRRKARNTYCAATPVDPEQVFYSCKYSPQECVSTGFAEAGGQVGALSGFILILFGVLSASVFGIPKFTRKGGGDGMDKCKKKCNRCCSGKKSSEVAPDVEKDEEFEDPEADPDERIDNLQNFVVKGFKEQREYFIKEIENLKSVKSPLLPSSLVSYDKIQEAQL